MFIVPPDSPTLALSEHSPRGSCRTKAFPLKPNTETPSGCDYGFVERNADNYRIREARSSALKIPPRPARTPPRNPDYVPPVQKAIPVQLRPRADGSRGSGVPPPPPGPPPRGSRTQGTPPRVRIASSSSQSSASYRDQRSYNKEHNRFENEGRDKRNNSQPYNRTFAPNTTTLPRTEWNRSDCSANISDELIDFLTPQAEQEPAKRSISPGVRKRSPSPKIVDTAGRHYTVNDIDQLVEILPTMDAQKEHDAYRGVPQGHCSVQHSYMLPDLADKVT